MVKFESVKWNIIEILGEFQGVISVHLEGHHL